MVLPHSHMTLTISLSLVIEGLLVSHLSISPFGTSSSGVAASLPFDHEALINLDIFGYREVTEATFIYANVFMTCFKYFVIIKFSKLWKKDKCSCGS